MMDSTILDQFNKSEKEVNSEVIKKERDRLKKCLQDKPYLKLSLKCYHLTHWLLFATNLLTFTI